MWYAKKVTFAAFLGYGAGIATYLAQNALTGQFAGVTSAATETAVAASNLIQAGLTISFLPN